MLIGTHGDGPGWVKRVFPSGQPYTDVTQLGNQIKTAITPVVNAGQHPFFSFKPPINGTAAQWSVAGQQVIGVCDPFLHGNPNLKIYVAVWHEPENDMTGQQYVTIQNFFYQYLKTNSLFPSRLLIGPVHMAYQWAPGRNVTNPADWIPAHFDFRGVDVYTHNLLPMGSLRQHAGYQRWLDSVDDDRDVFLVERGIDVTDAGQLDALKEDIGDLKVMNAYGYLYWNTAANGHNYPLGPAATQYLAGVAQAEQTSVPPPPPPPPATYTQAQYDAAVALAQSTGYTNGLASAYADMRNYIAGR